MSTESSSASRQPVAKASALADGQMMEVEQGEQKILLARVDGIIYAVEGKCPHYGASLAEGVLCGDRVVCPWHKACFRVTDGALLEPPALDALRQYQVSVEDDRIYIAPQEAERAAKKTAVTDKQHCVILGAGAAGVAAAEALRDNGFAGRITLITAESDAPCDRTKLSKEFLSGNATADELPLHPESFYEERTIERLHKNATAVEVSQHRVTFEDGAQLVSDSLLLATGSRPRRLQVPGSDLGNVFVLRSERDAETILANSQPGVRAVIVGGSFIALEAASCFGIRKIPTTVVMPENVPFEKKLGAEVGRAFLNFHQAHGIEFRLQAEIDRFEGTGIVREVLLRSGERLPADVVVIGVGVQPATEMFLDLPKRADGGIVVDRFLRAAPGVYAAGDIAVFPENITGVQARIEHWRVAEQQGRVAGANMAGGEQPYEGVPYFWTNHFGTRFDYVGHAEKWQETIIQGDLKKPEFIAFYVVDGEIKAAAACQRDREIAALHELMRLRQVPTPEAIRRGVDLVAELGSCRRAPHI